MADIGGRFFYLLFSLSSQVRSKALLVVTEVVTEVVMVEVTEVVTEVTVVTEVVIMEVIMAVDGGGPLPGGPLHGMRNYLFYITK